MQNTMQLLARALEQYTAAELARRVGVARQTFTDAKAYTLRGEVLTREGA